MKRLYKAFAVLLALLFVMPLSVFPSAEKSITVKADGFNTARLEGQLIIYTPDMGASTGTNEWGYEVIVVDNVATGFSTGDSAIPSNGFVLSGHNADVGGKQMGKWIEENIKAGDYVYYNANGIVTVSDKPIKESLFYSISTTYDAVNATRGADMIVIYTKLGTLTDTNEWGYEVVCTAGVVTKLGENNNRVPHSPGSFVVSAHGEKVEWLQTNVRLGMKVSYDVSTKKLTFSYDENSALSGIDTLFNDAKTLYDSALDNYSYIDLDAAKTAFNKIEADVKKIKAAYKKDKDGEKLAASCDEIEKQISGFKKILFESKTVEYRSVWIRPTQTSAEEVDAYVQKLYDLGINTLCIETLYDCTMIMPMPKDSLFATNPKFKHFDMLKSYIDSCHKRDMELHIWLPIYYVGDKDSSNIKLSVATKKPEWVSVSDKGSTINNDEIYIMLDPANKEAGAFLLNTYKYILETYDIDGFQIDYIRYYNRTSAADYGYSKIALDEFKEKYGVRPSFDTSASYWNDWVEFRSAYITEFVSQIRKLIDETAPDVLLGADVVPNPATAKAVNYQDYMTWLEEGWLDILFPMSYGYNHEESIKAQVKRASDKAFVAVGLGSFMDEMTVQIIGEQVNYNNSVYADGSSFFEASAFINKKTGEYLADGVFRNKAITPALDKEKAAKAKIEYTKGRINDVILKLKGVSASDASKIVSALDALAATFTEKGFDTEKYNEAYDAINNADLKNNAKTVLLADLLSSVKAYSVANKELDLSGVPDIPDAPVVGPDASQDASGEASSDSSAVVSGESSASGENDGSSGSIIWIVLGIIAAAAVIAAVVVILKKKGK